MDNALIDYQLSDYVATIRIDDGKRNAFSPELIAAIGAAFERAGHDHATVILTGREDVFSAGFDLKVMQRGGADALKMLGAGYALPASILRYPYPVIAACNGHVLAMGVFVMLAADYVIGTRGDFKVAANEVAIGLTMPRVAAAMLRHRLTPAAYQRAVTLSEFFPVEDALNAGFFDELVDSREGLLPRAAALADEFRKLEARAHTATKRRIRRALIAKIWTSIPLDLADAAWLGFRRSRAR